MRAFILRKLQLKKQATQTSTTPPAAPLSIPMGAPHAQRQCVLFNTLSLDVRLLIYEAALADPNRLLHFLHVTPRHGRPKKLGHWRCQDMDSPYLTWQHVCFGVWAERQARVTRDASRTNGDLISLLLTCRQIYNEAVEVLYSQNHFSFRGATGLPSFRALIAPSNWAALRCVHISTTFLTPMRYRMNTRRGFPPENYLDWKDGCRNLTSLTKLQLLQIDMIMWDDVEYLEPGAGTVEDEALVYVLSALKPITARIFRVELNIDVPGTVLAALGPVPFELSRHGKLHNDETFPLF